MIVSTTPTLEGKRITAYLGLVTGEAIMGANVVRDFLAGITDIVGGRSAEYEQELAVARKFAVAEMTEKAASIGANAVVGIDIDYETIGANGSMLMVSVSGTAVTVVDDSSG